MIKYEKKKIKLNINKNGNNISGPTYSCDKQSHLQSSPAFLKTKYMLTGIDCQSRCVYWQFVFFIFYNKRTRLSILDMLESIKQNVALIVRQCNQRNVYLQTVQVYILSYKTSNPTDQCFIIVPIFYQIFCNVFAKLIVVLFY